jgi:hypothetical protein
MSIKFDRKKIRHFTHFFHFFGATSFRSHVEKYRLLVKSMALVVFDAYLQNHW